MQGLLRENYNTMQVQANQSKSLIITACGCKNIVIACIPAAAVPRLKARQTTRC